MYGGMCLSGILTICGIAMANNEFLRPNWSEHQPITIVPIKPPIPIIEPIQAISDMDTRPDGNGLSSESYNRNALEIHPIVKAYPIVNRFTLSLYRFGEAKVRRAPIEWVMTKRDDEKTME